MSAKKTKPNARVLLMFIFAFVLVGCGKNSGNSSSDAQTVPIDPVTGQPIPGTGTGACIPLGQPITFSAQNIYMDYANIVGGTVPYGGQSAGHIVTGSGVGGGQYTSQGTSQVQIAMNISGNVANTQLPYTGYPNQSMFFNQGQFQQQWGFGNQQFPYGYNGFNQGSGRVNATGVIQISSMIIQAIQAKVMSGQIQIPGFNNFSNQNGFPNGYYNNGSNITTGLPYGNQQMPQICVSGVALNIGRFDTRLYSGQIYLYLNGSTHGYVTGIY
jgi:hypothetical protein